MKKRISILIMACMLSSFCFAKGDNVYIIFYATCKGKTGHLGIAVDNYHVVFRDIIQENKTVQAADTLTTGELTYYDFWPNDDYFSVGRTGKDIPANYYKLPVSASDEITVNSLYDKGIPHKEHYPSDGLLKITTSWQQDQDMLLFLDSMISANRQFNARRFNCSDFVRVPVERLLNRELKSREFILVGWSTTPNKFYRNLRRLPEVEVIKNADKKASRSFIGQRVVYKILHRSRATS